MILFTARYHTRDRDWLDITRLGCDRLVKAGKPAPGEFLAPSWDILSPALAWRRAFEARCDREGLDEQAEYFRVYAGRYRAEMVTSYRVRRAEWDALLALERVVLACFCADPARCHRTLAAGFLARCGADYRGELTEADRIPPPTNTPDPPAVLVRERPGKCQPFVLTDGTGRGFVCGDRPRARRCRTCGATASLLCDFPRERRTCDAPICAECAREVGEDRHHCPAHDLGPPGQVAVDAPDVQTGWKW